jgi:orotate phosphoribosyltransferase
MLGIIGCMRDALLDAIPARRGHFRLESGHHSDLWLELELLYVEPERARPLAVELARRLPRADVVCGPLVEGAFVALTVAEELRAEFAYAERLAQPDREGLFPVEYRLPGALRDRVRGRSVIVANDVIAAGSAVRGTLADLVACGARPVAIGALLVLGDAGAELAAAHAIPLESLAAREHAQWEPGTCPLCANGVPLADLSH